MHSIQLIPTFLHCCQLFVTTSSPYNFICSHWGCVFSWDHGELKNQNTFLHVSFIKYSCLLWYIEINFWWPQHHLTVLFADVSCSHWGYFSEIMENSKNETRLPHVSCIEYNWFLNQSKVFVTTTSPSYLIFRVVSCSRRVYFPEIIEKWQNENRFPHVPCIQHLISTSKLIISKCSSGCQTCGATNCVDYSLLNTGMTCHSKHVLQIHLVFIT